ncbi:MAG: DNA polymerase II [Gammaproteobacteria bacterium]|nr:DNA polymerase II [Gammaproteobacteria bacterium]
MAVRGFILQASYRIRERVPVVHLFGRLEGGGTFLVRDHRRTPSFYVAASDAARSRELGATRQCETPKRTFAGAPVTRIDVQTPPDAPVLRDRLHANGIHTFEADVRFAVRFLIDHNIRGGLEIEGVAQRGEGVDWIFDDPEIGPAEVEVEPGVLSFDIETDPKAQRLLAISLYAAGVDEVYIVDSSGREMPEHAIACADESEGLAAFCRRVAELDPDILTGWNVVDFDLRVLSRIAARLKQPFDLGREPGNVRIRPAQGYFGSGQATIPGRLVLDGMDLVRGAFARFDDYSLDAVSRSVLGEGKAVEGDVRDRAGEIIRRYRTDLPGFALYARTDARLVLEIIEQMRLVPLALARSRLTGMQPDRVSASIASFDFVYLAELHKRDIVAPSVRSGDARVSASQAGGHVLEPKTGLHRNVWVFDFKSLYPSVMRTFNIDPLGFVAGTGTGEKVILTVTGAAFRRDDAILPRMLDRLAEAREVAKGADDDIASQAIKILMNSFYGVLGTPACRFHNPAIANAITGQSRHFLLWSKTWFEDRGFDVLYGDTDSLFVFSGLADPIGAQDRGGDLVREINAAIADYVREKWNVESRLELEFEKLYTRLFLPSVRHGSAGARKRYTGVRHGGDTVEFVGMEVVRRDWTDLAKTVQRELYARLFADAPVDDYLAQVVRDLRSGSFDEALVYRKGLRKRLQDYTANTPPHVAAARKSRSDPGRLISYVMTRNGPEPLDNITADLDREHYVQRQVRPVAEPVLDTFGLSFEQAIGDDRQMELF